jgi:hypothetical protein
VEAAKIEAARVEAAKVEAARAEAAKVEAARVEAARAQAAMAEAARAEAARAEAARAAQTQQSTMHILVHKPTASTKLGITLSSDGHGLVHIVRIRPDGAAAAVPQLQPGQRVVAVNGVEVHDHQNATKALQASWGQIYITVQAGTPDAHAAKVEAARVEAARVEAARAEAARAEAARVEAARVEAARVEAARVEAARVEAARPALTLADVGNLTGREDVPESSIGGQTTCIVCMTGLKSHLAVPCGHQSVCATCSAKMQECPYCRQPVQLWVQQRMV